MFTDFLQTALKKVMARLPVVLFDRVDGSRVEPRPRAREPAKSEQMANHLEQVIVRVSQRVRELPYLGR